MNAEAVKELVRLESNLKLITLITIIYKDNTYTEQRVRYTDSDTDFVYNNEIYTSYDFEVKPATFTDSGVTDGSLTLSSVDNEWIARLRNMPEKPHLNVKYIIIYGEQEKQELMDDMTYMLTSTSWNELSINWTMLYDDKMNLIVPCDKGTVNKIPALG